MQSLPKDLRESGMTKIVAVDVLIEDDLAIAILATDGAGPIAVNDEGREFFVLEDSPTRTGVAYDGVLGATLGVRGRDRGDSSARGSGVRPPGPEAGGLDGRRRVKRRCSLSVWARFSPNDLVFQLQFAGADRLVDHLPDFLVQLVLRPDAVRGPQQSPAGPPPARSPRPPPHQPTRDPQADAQLTLSGGDDHRQRVGDASSWCHRLSLRACITVRFSLGR
ncbi:MAG TPA: hypothetical protein VI094_05390 [Propionibacteriaceae bacterium]